MKHNTKHQRYTTGEWLEDRLKSWWAWIYVGGDLATAEMVCRESCFERGLCVTIKPVKYIFTGGTEEGVQIGMIKYVPFPEEKKALVDRAIKLGQKIAEANFQWSYTVITRDESIYRSRRRS